MSHFVVAVMTKELPNESVIEDVLAPYYEGLDMERHISKTKKEIIEYQKRHIEDYKKGTYAEYLKNPSEYEAKYGSNNHHIEYLKEIFPKMMKETDEELYLRYIDGIPKLSELEDEYGEAIDEDGNLTSTYNEKSKWDWWVIGGRWQGELPLKTGVGANSAQVSKIDWGNDVDPDEYVKEHPEIKERYEKLITEGDGWYKVEYLRQLYPTLRDYVIAQVRWVPFAFVDVNGEWQEKGEMGWFGCSSDTPEDNRNWNENFYDKFIKGNETCYVTLVDCHI